MRIFWRMLRVPFASLSQRATRIFLPDEPLVVADGPGQAAAEGDGPGLDSMLALNAAAAYTPPAVVKRGRRILPKTAQALVRSLQPLPSDMLNSGVPRLTSFLLDATLGRSTALATTTKLRRECGVSAGSWHDTCDAISYATFQVLRGTFERFARSLLGCAGQGAAGLGVETHWIRWFTFRFRSYDGTKQFVRVVGNVSTSVGSGSASFIEPSAAKYEVYVSSASRAFCLMKGARPQSRLLTLMVREPTLLHTSDGTKAESTNAALAHLACSVDVELERMFLRNVDVVITDEAGANIRYENARRAAASRPSALLHLFCDAHEKSKVASLGHAVQRPTDTMLIRMQLATRGNMPRIMKAMRGLLAERLVIVHGGSMEDAGFGDEVAGKLAAALNVSDAS
ncbi:unnamed protein product [Prorocentrum cordatum]|uniref:Uncharacterized protein n=1 Tax=Prorocentrum cordatum TaxID=2364126 RepID=A0ABN9TKP4_9DINO|nr:unnamed protein product [Polarella glacialis]